MELLGQDLTFNVFRYKYSILSRKNLKRRGERLVFSKKFCCGAVVPLLRDRPPVPENGGL